MVIDLSMITRVYVVPPGTSRERIGALRQAFARVTKDPAFVADWERIMGEDEFASVAVSAELAEKLKNNFMEPAPWQEFLRAYAKE
jgi:tripartite-type tricarboxylate transporter receptor subunit TctC